MKLTPMDINNKEFKRGLRGYNPEEVDEFLDEIIENYEELYKDNAKLKEKLVLSNEQIEHYTKIESTIQNTLILAQNAADQAKTSAEKQAELVVKNANETAQRILDKAHNDTAQLTEEYEKIKQDFIKFRAKFRNFMNTQLQTFNELEKDVLKNYSVSKPSSEELEAEEETEVVESFEEDIVGAEVQSEVEKKKVDLEEINLEDTMCFSKDSFKSIEKDIMKNDIDEIKSFFANSEEEE